MLADGMTTTQIAGKLWLSVHTVKAHWVHARRRVNARNLHHLVAIALRRGEVT
jgi:DNA-binding CsgD family transcriptional regulator